MLAKKQLLEFIGTKLAHLQACVATLNAIRFFDLNVASEDFFASLLNAVYRHNLVNLNHDSLNKAAVDLGDKTKRIAVQVTSERTKSKIQKTIDKFAKQGLGTDYDSLKVLIIGKRTGDYPTLIVPSGVTFSGKNDVIDIPHLMRDISRFGFDDLVKIAALVKKELRDASADFLTATADRQNLDQIAAKELQIATQEVKSLVERARELTGELRGKLLDEKHSDSKMSSGHLAEQLDELSNCLTPRLYAHVKNWMSQSFATKYIQVVGRVDELVGDSLGGNERAAKRLARRLLDSVDRLLAEIRDGFELS